jgi:hypothetical protein
MANNTPIAASNAALIKNQAGSRARLDWLETAALASKKAAAPATAESTLGAVVHLRMRLTASSARLARMSGHHCFNIQVTGLCRNPGCI